MLLISANQMRVFHEVAIDQIIEHTVEFCVHAVLEFCVHAVPKLEYCPLYHPLQQYQLYQNTKTLIRIQIVRDKRSSILLYR